jgi:hypothetical protein
MSRAPLPLLAVLVTAGLAACSSTPAASGAKHDASAVAAHAQPAGPNPSATARMICAHEAQDEVAGVLATKPTLVSTPTWADHLYSCDYVFPAGTVTLAVKELDDLRSTTAYFDSLASTLGRIPDTVHLGQGAFQTPTGSIVVRKDFKVLLVDVTRLPNGFGRPGLDPPGVASAIAITVLGCWS